MEPEDIVPGTPSQPLPAEPLHPEPMRVARPGSHKIAVGTVAGALTVVGVWALKAAGLVEVPTEVAQQITILCSVVVGLAVPDDMEAP